MTYPKLRRALAKVYGPKNFRIRATGAVEVYGTMPHTNKVGWFHKFDTCTAEAYNFTETNL